MATHFGEDFLHEQLNSINNQTVTPFELVVCDDCSTDGTRRILEEFASSACFPVRLHFNQEKLGYIDNFLKAIHLCKGDFIALSDQDDVWYDNKLEVSLNLLRKENAWLHAHSVTLIDRHGSSIGNLRPLKASGPVSYETFSPWGVFSGFTCTFRKELMDLFPQERRPIDLIYGDKLMAHDRWITHLGLLTGQVVYSDTPLAAYRQHHRNVFGARRVNTIKKLKKFRREYVNYLNKRASISESMYSISKNFSNNASYKAHNNTVLWAGLARKYSERRRIFRDNHGLFKRCCALLVFHSHDRDLMALARDLLAAIALTFNTSKDARNIKSG